jgi:hypothetical protein
MVFWQTAKGGFFMQSNTNEFKRNSRRAEEALPDVRVHKGSGIQQMPESIMPPTL